MSVFNILNNTVKELAVSRFKEPTSVQELAIPKILEGKNVLVIAETGSGKTESTLLPIFSKLVEKEYKPIAILYLTPLKSLNRDLLDRLVWWCNKLDIDISVRHGDTTQYERKMQLEYPPQILISTPEQIGAMLVGKRIKEHLKNIKFIVIDEIHEIVNSKRGIQLTLSLERLKKLCGKPQMLALSATVGSPETAAKFIFSDSEYEIIKAISTKDIDLKVESPFPSLEDKALAEKIFIGNAVAARLRKIYELAKQHRSALTFTNTREATEILSSRLRLLDKEFPHEVHHSSLSKEVRIKAEKDFKEEKLKNIICTSSLQLGIDIGSVDIVLQYMSPRTVTQLTQRIGRSGHGVGRTSKGIIIAADGDDIFESAVIARKALSGELEPLRIHKNSLDVLAQQIVGMAMSDYNLDPKSAYETIKKASPYKDLTEREFIEVCKFLEQIHLIFARPEIRRKRKAFEYYFENLSVIPDSKSYKVIDSASDIPIGTLDEEFIVSHGEVGSSFIVKGRPWKIISVDGNKIYVEAIDSIESAIPAWEGELIPVPYEVANEVGKLRFEITEMLKELKDKEIIKRLEEKYPVSTQSATKMVQLIKKQIKKYTIPDNQKILFEKFREYVVLHVLFGTLVNETLSRFIAAILSAEYGEAISSKCDPYRIIFRGCNIEDIKKVLFNYKPEDIEIILEKALPRSSLFKYRFVHIAKRFGAISKIATFDKINIDKIIDVYMNSPIYTETLNELFTEKLDLEKTKEILKEIQTEKIRIQEIEGLSPLGELGFRYELSDIAKPERAEKEIFKIFKKRLLDTKVRLLCINCGKYSVTKYVKEIEAEPRCFHCGSKLIAALRAYQVEAQDIVKKKLAGKELTEDEKKKYERVRLSADLVIDCGIKAILVLAGRGVGPQTAIRILGKPNLTEEELLKNILKEERAFIANKKFWD